MNIQDNNFYKNAFFQLMFSLEILKRELGISVFDTGSIGFIKTKDTEYVYTINDIDYTIPTNGYRVLLFDTGYRDDIHNWQTILNIFALKIKQILRNWRCL